MCVKQKIKKINRISLRLEVRLCGGHKLVSNGALADGASGGGCSENGDVQCVKKGSFHGEVRIGIPYRLC